MAYNKDSPKNIIPALTGIDKKLAANFSVIVLILMLIVALACFMVYSKIAENNEKELQKTIVNLLADSINRISFSGKYHARLLVDQIVSSQKKIAGIMILTPSFEVLAQSRDDRGIPYDFVFEKSLVKEVYEKKKPIITDPETRNDSIRQVAFPYRSGYRNKVTGVILVDLITDCSLRVNSYIHAYLFLLILVLTIVSLVIIYIISKKISGPVIDMAWQFEKILSHSPFLIRISDNSKKVLAKSLSLEKIDEMIFSETPQQKEEFLEIATDQVFEKNEFIEKELSLTVQGRKLTFWVTGFPVLKTEKGLTQMACSIALDITDRKQAEQELKNQEKNLQITLDSIGEAVIATDSDNRITRMNPVAQRLTGWSLKEAMGLDLDKVFCIYDFAERRVIKNSIKKLLEPLERKEVSGRNILVSRSGTEYQIENSGALIRTELDEIKGAVFVFRDVTEKYTLIENLSHKSKMDAIGQLAGGVAHDFNNLLSGIMSAAELIGIQLEESEEDVTQLINVIMQSSSRAADLISKLLAFGRKSQYY
jgi:PAS domain S-box-containing protein